MAGAALTPRVRTIVICDEVIASPTEEGVFTIEGARLHIGAQSFPWRAPANLFLLLSCPRRGRYPGKVLVVDEGNDKAVRYAKFVAEFEEDNQLLPFYVEMEACTFPEPGSYRFEIYFSVARGDDVLKGEHPLRVLLAEE